MISVLTLRRRRALAMRTVGVAAGFIVLVIVAIVGTPTVPGSGSGNPYQYGLPNQSTTAGSSPTHSSPTPAPVPSLDLHTGIGGPDLAGERFSATDPVTGVRLDVLLISFPWGTQIGVSMFNVAGPLECRLYAVDRAGTASVVASGRVDDSGYGTAVNPEALTL